MSVELPEAYILASQMSKELQGKEIDSYVLQYCEKLQRLGFVNKDASGFDRVCGKKIESIQTRGLTIRVKLNSCINLILAPEYGGKILYHPDESTLPLKFHLLLRFQDDTTLTVTLTGMGVIQTLEDEELKQSYVYRRDFSAVASPTEDSEFTLERFTEELAHKTVNIKSALVGKDAVVVGLSNSAFQDIIYRAGIHPKRKASGLTKDQKQSLFQATKSLIQERISAGGKTQFIDLYGRPGNYTSLMGPNMKGKSCTKCSAKTEVISLGGGQVHYCPRCQEETAK